MEVLFAVAALVAIVVAALKWGSDLFRRYKQHQRCREHRPYIGRELTFDVSKPDEGWLRDNNAFCESQGDLNIPHLGYERWVCLCRTCGEVLRTGATNGEVAWPPADKDMVSALIRIEKMELQEVGATPRSHKWNASSWEPVEISLMTVWHGELPWLTQSGGEA